MNRRDFLKKLGLGSAAAVVVPSALLSESEPEDFAWGGWGPKPEPRYKWTADVNTGWYVEANGDLQFTTTEIRGT